MTFIIITNYNKFVNIFNRSIIPNTDELVHDLGFHRFVLNSKSCIQDIY